MTLLFLIFLSFSASILCLGNLTDRVPAIGALGQSAMDCTAFYLYNVTSGPAQLSFTVVSDLSPGGNLDLFVTPPGGDEPVRASGHLYSKAAYFTAQGLPSNGLSLNGAWNVTLASKRCGAAEYSLVTESFGFVLVPGNMGRLDGVNTSSGVLTLEFAPSPSAGCEDVSYAIFAKPESDSGERLVNASMQTTRDLVQGAFLTMDFRTFPVQCAGPEPGLIRIELINTAPKKEGSPPYLLNVVAKDRAGNVVPYSLVEAAVKASGPIGSGSFVFALLYYILLPLLVLSLIATLCGYWFSRREAEMASGGPLLGESSSLVNPAVTATRAEVGDIPMRDLRKSRSKRAARAEASAAGGAGANV